MATAGVLHAQNANPPYQLSLTPPSTPIWKNGVGNGFNEGAQELGLSGGGGGSMPIFGSQLHNAWALGALRYGYMLTDVRGDGTWHRGNWELLGELFGGMQFHPDSAYITGIAPHLRYDFATGHRVVPFVELGAGLTATDIRDSNLSTTFEFNLQLGAGTHVFLSDSLAVTLEYRFIHVSNAGLDVPNLGLNSSTGYLGITCFF